ncbi:MAG: hypothetical protein AAF492_24155, partial [Verrucomicrobiota bacterium]
MLDQAGPVLTIPTNITVECDASRTPSETGEATALDNCDTNAMLSFSDASSPGACPQELLIVRTWTARDGCGNETLADQEIRVFDTVAPVFASLPTNTSIFCEEQSGSHGGSGSGGSSGSGSPPSGPVCQTSEVPPPPILTATDNCDTNVSITMSDVQIGDCPGVIVRTWTATDDCMNTAEAVQMIALLRHCVFSSDTWGEHPDRWLTPFGMVTDLDVGCLGNQVSASQALAWFTGSSSGDVTIRLVRELVAAKLNLLQGVEDSEAETLIAEADDYLCVVPIGSRPRGMLRRVGRDLMRSL